MTFVHIGNILAVTDPIFTKRLGPDFLQALTSLIEIFLPKFSLTQIFAMLKYLFWTPIFVEQFFFNPKFLRHKHFWTRICFGLRMLSDSKFC